MTDMRSAACLRQVGEGLLKDRGCVENPMLVLGRGDRPVGAIGIENFGRLDGAAKHKTLLAVLKPLSFTEVSLLMDHQTRTEALLVFGVGPDGPSAWRNDITRLPFGGVELDGWVEARMRGPLEDALVKALRRATAELS